MPTPDFSEQSKAANKLATVLERTKDVAESVYQSLDISQRFVNGIADYARSKRATGFEEDIVQKWRAFTNTYVEFVWESRDIIVNEKFNIMNFQNIVPFLTDPDKPLEAKTAKVEAFLAASSQSPDRADTLAYKLQDLLSSIKIWKVELAGKISHLKVKDDGSSSYRLLTNDLRDLRDHLMCGGKEKGDSWEDLSDIWLHDLISPMKVDMDELATGLRTLWVDEKSILKRLLFIAESTSDIAFDWDLNSVKGIYARLADAAVVYDEGIYEVFYWRYTKAQRESEL